MLDIFYDFDLSVSTHRNEGFGIVHLESLAACTPVVAYNSGGLTEILNNGGGITAEGGIDELAKEIRAVLNNDEKRRELGIEGRQVVEDYFSLETMAQNHYDFYNSMCRGNGAH
jgi:glycosyltransferase involved in cell wall biosynthesis